MLKKNRLSIVTNENETSEGAKAYADYITKVLLIRAITYTTIVAVAIIASQFIATPTPVEGEDETPED